MRVFAFYGLANEKIGPENAKRALAPAAFLAAQYSRPFRPPFLGAF
jgi:hypothetical protein